MFGRTFVVDCRTSDQMCCFHCNSQLAYVEGWKLINLANETFGFNGWSHSVTHQNIGEDAVLIIVAVSIKSINQ